jgi:hypothetical protein
MATKTHQQTPIFFNKSVSRSVSFSVYSNETKKDARVPVEQPHKKKAQRMLCFSSECLSSFMLLLEFQYLRMRQQQTLSMRTFSHAFCKHYE